MPFSIRISPSLRSLIGRVVPAAAARSPRRCRLRRRRPLPARPAPAPNCQFGRPCWSTSRWICGSTSTKRSTSSAPRSRGQTLSSTCSALSRAMSASAAPGALAKPHVVGAQRDARQQRELERALDLQRAPGEPARPATRSGPCRSRSGSGTAAPVPRRPPRRPRRPRSGAASSSCPRHRPCPAAAPAAPPASSLI